MEPFPSQNQHLTNEELQAFSLGTLSSEASHRISDHLAFCPRCRLAFAEIMTSIEVPIDSSVVQKGASDDPVPNDLEKLLRIPGYRQLERIAQGGMGYIYIAKQEQTNKTVAIKVIQPRYKDAYGSERKKRLVREAHALTKIDHPNIVHPLEVVMVNDAPALVMEFIQGQPLNRWIREHKPDYVTSALFAKQLTQAIVHAHQRGVVHCDLKPQNVIVTAVDSKPWLKIIDFGLAKLSDEDWNITCSGDVLGTPAYMAPEQTSGSVLKANPAIDVYGLGAILYELLTGRPPFEAPTSAMLLSKVALHSPRRPSRIKPDLPASLELICMKCLEKRPEDRYASAAQLAQDLQAFLDNRAINAKAPTLFKTVTRWIRTNRAICLALFLSSAIAVFGVFATVNLWREAHSKANIGESLLDAESQRLDASKRAEQAEDAILDELRTSLRETTELLFGTPPEKEDAEWQTLDRLAKRWSRFADRIPDSKRSRLIQAEALMRIGSIHALLGDLGSAEEKFSLALKTLPENISSTDDESRRLAIESETHWQIARSLFDTGKTNESNQAFQDSRSCIRKAIELEQDDVQHRLLEAKILCDFGTMLTRTSRMDEAQQLLNESISSLEKLLAHHEGEIVPTVDANFRTDTLKQLWASRIALARVMRMRGSITLSIAILESNANELVELEELVAEDPSITQLIFLHKLAIGMCNLDQGKLEPCNQSLLDAMTIQEQLIKRYPRRQDVLKNYASLHGTLAVVSIRLRRNEEALNYIFKSLGIHSELAERFPDRKEYLGEKAKSLTNLVAILAAGNRLDEANLYGSQLIDLQSRLSSQYPDQAEYGYGLAASLNIVATVLGRIGMPFQAYDYFNQSQAGYLELIERNPSVTNYRMGLANTCFSKAELARLHGEWSLALEAYSQTIDAIYAGKPSAPLAESMLLAKAYLGQAVAFKGLNDLPMSRACAQLGAETIEPWRNKDPQGQEILRRCLELSPRFGDGSVQQ